MSKAIRIITGVALLIVSLSCAAYALRNSAGYALFFEAKYIDEGDDARVTLATCDSAAALCSSDYALCVFAADTAFMAATDTTVENRKFLLDESEKWCDRGLALNSRDRRLWFRKMGLLGLSPDTKGEALRVWTEYTDWDYWNPDNHYYLAVMNAWLGDLDEADRELSLTKGSVYYANAKQAVRTMRERARAAE